MSGPCPSSDRKPSRPRAGLCHDRYDFYPLSYIDCESGAAPKWRGPPECVLISSIYRNPSLSRLPRIRPFQTYVCIRMSTSHLHARHVIALFLFRSLPTANGVSKEGWVGLAGGVQMLAYDSMGSHFSHERCVRVLQTANMAWSLSAQSSTFSDESSRRHIYIRNEHIVWVSCRRFMSWIVIDSSNLCLPLYVAADWKFTDNYYLEILIDILHYVFPSLCVFLGCPFWGLWVVCGGEGREQTEH